MPIHEIEAKSILRKQKTIDSWFVSRYGLNLYRGCSHDCSYCDGRAESYQVEGNFAADIAVKINAPSLLDKELNPKRKRKPMNRSFIVISGGVNDCYQPIEKKYELSRQALSIIEKWKFPVHVLTKSTLVERDIDLLQDIKKQSATIVSFSLSTTDDNLAAHFEPHVPSPTLRLQTIKKLNELGIPSGVFLMPLIPLLSDTKEHLKQTLKDIKQAGAQYVIFGGMTLKPGRQREHFYDVAKAYDPKLIAKYRKMYGENKLGSPIDRYNPYIHNNFKEALAENPMPVRIPAKLFQHILTPFEFMFVILSQMDYLYQHHGYAKKNTKVLSFLYKNYNELQYADLVVVKSVLGDLYSECIEQCLQKEIPAEYEWLLYK